MRKPDAKFRNKLAPLQFRISEITETGEQPACGISRRYCNVAIRTNRRGGPLACKKLGAMTFETTRVLGKIRNVREGRIAFAHNIPILRGHFVTGSAGKLLPNHVRGVRELCVIDFWLRCDFRLLRARLRATPLRTPLRLRVAGRTYCSRTQGYQQRRESDESDCYEFLCRNLSHLRQSRRAAQRL